MPAPPYELVDNEATWLDFTDLVFIDPVGTGYSRARKPELGRRFWSVEGDVQSVGEFIRLYLGRAERWGSPLFLVGESYGTTRAAGLSGYLADRGIAFNGIMLVSSILNFQTARFTQGNDLPDPETTRFYLLSGLSHGVGHITDRKENQQFTNGVSPFPAHRALLIALDQWVSQGVAPPDSEVPAPRGTTFTPLSWQ